MTAKSSLHPLRRAKREGIAAEVAWSAICRGVESVNMRPSVRAMSYADHFERFEKVYGKRAAAAVRARNFRPIEAMPLATEVPQ